MHRRHWLHRRGKTTGDRGVGAPDRLADRWHKEALTVVDVAKVAVRAFVGPPFRLMNNLVRHQKTRYRGLAKSGYPLHTLFGLANVVIAARRLAV